MSDLGDNAHLAPCVFTKERAYFDASVPRTGRPLRSHRFDRTVLCFLGLSIVALYAIAAPDASNWGERLRVAIVFDGDFADEAAGPTWPIMKPMGILALDTSHKLFNYFASLGYRLEDVRQGVTPVPPIFLTSLPGDLPRVLSVDTRKHIFLKTMLPLVLDTNEKIRAERLEILRLRDKERSGEGLGSADRLRLESIAQRYDLDRVSFDGLLRRVDIVPPALALAQAAEESGWGTSRYAQEGNALFGQYTYGSSNGFVPLAREEGASHKVRTFDGLADAVRAYAHNLNTNEAYREFRLRREQLRVRFDWLESIELIETLNVYSERGPAYVESLRRIIVANQLQDLDRARLRQPRI